MKRRKLTILIYATLAINGKVGSAVFSCFVILSRKCLGSKAIPVFGNEYAIRSGGEIVRCPSFYCCVGRKPNNVTRPIEPQRKRLFKFNFRLGSV